MSLFGISVSSGRRWAHVLAISLRIVLGCILASSGLLVGGASAQVITEFSAGGFHPRSITAGPDGNLWFTARPTCFYHCYFGGIGRITPAGVVTKFSGFAGFPASITAGPDGNLWFTDPFSSGTISRIGRITPAGVVTEFSAGITDGAYPAGITAGPDGNLWFTEPNGNRIGRITPAGVVTEFSAGITDGAYPAGITAGPDGNLWFTEAIGIGRITPLGVVTEFSAGLTASPSDITAGPDGNLWFTEPSGNRIGRITPAGVVTEFSAVNPTGITAGPDGNLWFTDQGANQIGRITPLGVVTYFSAGISAKARPGDITAGPDGNLWFTEAVPSIFLYDGRIGRITPPAGLATVAMLSVDVHSETGTSSNLNGVFEPGETIQIEPGWLNITGGSVALTGTASNFTGPAGATYSIGDGTADYGTVAVGASANCYSATANCYRMSVSNPPNRPALHWDATLLETLSTGGTATHVLHIGHSFPDVPDANIMYGFVETLLHNEVTLGYGDGAFRPSNSSIRAFTLMFVARGMVAPNGDTALPASGNVIAGGVKYPFNCIAGGISLFVDVQPTDVYCKHVHALAVRGVNVSYACVDATHACPANNTSRAAMAVVVAGAAAREDDAVPANATYSDTGSPRSYDCFTAGGSHFTDVAPTDAHCRHVNYLWARGMIDGYGDGTFGPDDMVTRGQIAKFITNGFGLSLD